MHTKDMKHAKHSNQPAKADMPTRSLPSDLEQLFTSELQGQICITEKQLSMTVPPASVISEYIPYYPEAPQTFFRWSEEEAAHRRKLDEAMVTSQIRDGRLGLWLGFAVALCGLGIAGLATWWRQPWVAAILGGARLFPLRQLLFAERACP